MQGGFQEFDDWLKRQDRRACTAIAFRATMRVLPFAMAVPNRNSTPSALFLPLATVRACLVVGLHLCNTVELMIDPNVLISFFRKGLQPLATPENYSADAALNAVASISLNNPSELASGAVNRAESACFVFSLKHAPHFSNASTKDAKLPYDQLVSASISRSNTVRAVLNGYAKQHGNLLEHYRWAFWREWYQGFLDGKPLDWELQRRVALIDDAIWEAGPEAVAEEIEKIRALFELEKRIEELEAERDAARVQQDRLGIGGNNPPADQQIEVEVVETVTMIWADIDALKEEAQKDYPVKALVAGIIDRLGMGLKRLLALCGRLGEHALKVAVGTVVATGTVSIIKPELLELVIEAAKRWLAVL